MKEFNYVIQDEQGIHARPAGVLVKAANEFQSDIQIDKDGKKGDLKRIFGVMGLGIKKGDNIRVIIEGPDEEMAAQKIETLFKEQL
ncbi:HPr family phosphocarrier protein [Frisingicoccus sp.]|uniref:HPr family phosphocarrier protein n=1 Tax=Frisingicoccus sp. TaxID=1918627 RepID=UPI00261E37F1|nr:HPr family phosphocarrier protein [Frisingicoccus sp.]MDD6232793.1 HPr family phosphocarrier protein [Frisingicoccus sp.]MDY4922101.1 HPr family phosphocarrier protein [Frisingicoccus sp.]